MPAELATAPALFAWSTTVLLASLRIAPVLLFAPPFTLVRVPRLVMALLSIAIAAMLVEQTSPVLDSAQPIANFVVAGLGELAIGIAPLLALQLMFGAVQVVGRTIDLQSGYGLALIIDPTSRTQTPLVGTIFALGAGATFFAMHGEQALLEFFAGSLRAVPPGASHGLPSLGALTSYMASVFTVALGVGGGVILVFFMTDIGIAMMARTVPQLNALVLGIKVKALLLLIALPALTGVAGAVFARLMTLALATPATLV